jgi:hypothetical protein
MASMTFLLTRYSMLQWPTLLGNGQFYLVMANFTWQWPFLLSNGQFYLVMVNFTGLLCVNGHEENFDTLQNS